MTLKCKIMKQNNEDFYQPNQGVDYIAHSSVRTCKQVCMGFLLLRLRAANGNVCFRYSIMRGAICGLDSSNTPPTSDM